MIANMTPMEALAEQISWAGRNIAHNLDFIAADKLDWKPAPTASSALEIINHAAFWIRSALSVLEGGEGKAEFAPATNRDEAKQLISSSAESYAAKLRELKPQDLEGTAKHPFDGIPLAHMMGMPVVDLIHHHGQIAYIQALQGDTESHFHE